MSIYLTFHVVAAIVSIVVWMIWYKTLEDNNIRRKIFTIIACIFTGIFSLIFSIPLTVALCVVWVQQGDSK